MRSGQIAGHFHRRGAAICGGGRIRTYVGQRPTDLQSVVIDRSTTPPIIYFQFTGRSRRSDLNRRPTVYKTVALPLSYTGKKGGGRCGLLPAPFETEGFFTGSYSGNSHTSFRPRHISLGLKGGNSFVYILADNSAYFQLFRTPSYSRLPARSERFSL